MSLSVVLCLSYIGLLDLLGLGFHPIWKILGHFLVIFLLLSSPSRTLIATCVREFDNVPFIHFLYLLFLSLYLSFPSNN